MTNTKCVNWEKKERGGRRIIIIIDIHLVAAYQTPNRMATQYLSREVLMVCSHQPHFAFLNQIITYTYMRTHVELRLGTRKS